jgi:hypothetical protein
MITEPFSPLAARAALAIHERHRQPLIETIRIARRRWVVAGYP